MHGKKQVMHYVPEVILASVAKHAMSLMNIGEITISCKLKENAQLVLMILQRWQL